MRRSVILLWVVQATSALAADEYPTSGIVYNTKENASLSYHCKRENLHHLECEFNESSIRIKSTDPDIQKQIAGMKQSLSKPDELKKASVQVCELSKQMDDLLTGKTPPTDPDAIAAKSAKSKALLRSMADHALKACKEPTLENLLALSKVASEAEKKTCIVSSWSFKRSFDRDIEGNWAVIPERTGICGVVRLDKFQPAKAKSDGTTLWDYVARNVVTNRDSKNPFCTGSDERESLYSWMSRPIEIECEHIEFGL